MNSQDKRLTIIIDPGHGVCVDPKCPLEERACIGIHENEAGKLTAHIEAGAAGAARNPASILVFSGGVTREKAAPRSKAAGLQDVARVQSWL